MQDPFSTKIHIVGHVLRKGKLMFTCKFGGFLRNTKVTYDELKVDVPAAVANYILLHRVGKGATGSESRKYYEWASRFIPSLRQAKVRLAETWPARTRGITCIFYKKWSSLSAKNKIKKQVSDKVVMIIM
jgi:hypothetical protein